MNNYQNSNTIIYQTQDGYTEIETKLEGKL
jgi:hypothetical protein